MHMMRLYTMCRDCLDRHQLSCQRSRKGLFHSLTALVFHSREMNLVSLNFASLYFTDLVISEAIELLSYTINF